MDAEPWYKKPIDSPFPHPTPPVLGIEEFNEALRLRLEESQVRTIGAGPLTESIVVVGHTLCRLASETTRAGAIAYLGKATSAGGVYSLVPSSEHVVRRLVPGRTPERIPGFYLYAQTPLEEPRVVSPVAPPMDHWEIAMLILESVSVLHQRGHQRLRVYPNIAGTGMAWRLRVVDVDNTRFQDDGLHWPEWDDASFAYTTAARYDVGGMIVDSNCTRDEVADHILRAFTEPSRAGHGRDWMYAGWFVEMLGSARRHHNLPVGDEPIRVDGRTHWTFLPAAGNSIEEPPAPK